MLRKADKISMQRLESKDLGKRLCMNVQNVICHLAEIAVGKEVVVRLNTHTHTHRYHETMVDLLD